MLHCSRKVEQHVLRAARSSDPDYREHTAGRGQVSQS